MIRICPKAFPLAVNMSDVAPMSEAASVRKFSLSNTANAAAIRTTEHVHSAISKGVKYFSAFFRTCMYSSIKITSADTSSKT